VEVISELRFAVHVTIPVESGNKMTKDPSGMQKLEEYVKMIKPEAAYFYERNGERSFFFALDLPSADMIPVVAEPLFQAFNARIEFHPAMTLDEVKKGVQKSM
jgi:hypothetical protein